MELYLGLVGMLLLLLLLLPECGVRRSTRCSELTYGGTSVPVLMSPITPAAQKLLHRRISRMQQRLPQANPMQNNRAGPSFSVTTDNKSRRRHNLLAFQTSRRCGPSSARLDEVSSLVPTSASFRKLRARTARTSLRMRDERQSVRWAIAATQTQHTEEDEAPIESGG